MKKNFFCLCLVALFCIAAPITSKADTFDFKSLNCEMILELDENEITFVYVWLDGYFAKAQNITTFNTDEIQPALQAIGEACQADPKKKLFDLFNTK
jgi:hypothetical protein